jgi:AraC-like DNA-binding protein
LTDVRQHVREIEPSVNRRFVGGMIELSASSTFCLRSLTHWRQSLEVPMAAMVRVQAVRGYRELVAELGGDPVRLLRVARIKSTAFDQPASLVSFGAVIRLLERSARDLACPDFGLRLAERQDIGILGPLAVAMRYSATVGEAMRCASKYIYVYNAAIGFSVRVEQGDDEALFAFEILSEHGFHSAQMIEHGVGITCRIVSMLSAGRTHPNRVWLPHPAAASRATYRRHLGAPVEFNAPLAALAIDRRDLDLPLGEHNEELRALAVDYLDVQFPARETSFPVQVRNVIERLLGTGACGYADVADALSTHPRTLQRRLREEGTTFEDIKDEARRDLARRYLAHRDVPLAQVTALLDYREQSALSRSCQRWFQTTPRALRASLSSGTATVA